MDSGVVEEEATGACVDLADAGPGVPAVLVAGVGDAAAAEDRLFLDVPAAVALLRRWLSERARLIFLRCNFAKAERQSNASNTCTLLGRSRNLAHLILSNKRRG